jgi:prepilin-type N-terminal cleavage/methylation domain-containing protein
MKISFQSKKFGERKSLSSRRGFTLLETMIAVALMLIVTIITYQGFMSSLQYSGNTAMFEKTSQAAVKDANLAIGAGNYKGTSDEGLLLQNSSGTYSQVLRVNTYDIKLVPTLVSGDPAYDESAQHAATNRYSFHYVVRPCTETTGCTGSVRFYDEGGIIVARCDKCKALHDSNVS